MNNIRKRNNFNLTGKEREAFFKWLPSWNRVDEWTEEGRIIPRCNFVPFIKQELITDALNDFSNR